MLKRFILFLSLCLVCAATAGAADAKQAPAKPVVVLETTLGTIKVELDPQAAPISVKNFLDYVNSGYYNGTTFHRVIPGFMIQGGGFTKEMQLKATKASIKNEADNGLKNDRGTIAMARGGDPNSATSQFFINVVNNDGLNRPKPDGFGYAVFGRVIEGMEVADRIVAVPTKNLNMVFQNVPVTPVVIKSAKVIK